MAGAGNRFGSGARAAALVVVAVALAGAAPGLAGCAGAPSPARRAVAARSPSDLGAGRQNWLSADTIEQIHSGGRREYVVAVVRCRSAEVTLRGTDNEQVRLATDTLAVGAGPGGGALEFVRHTRGGDTVMVPGRAYLVAAAPPPVLIEAIAVDGGRAVEIAHEAAREVRAHSPLAP